MVTRIPVKKVENGEDEKKTSPSFDINKLYQGRWRKADMSRLERKKKRPLKLIITIVVLLIAVGAALSGFFVFYSDKNKFVGDNVIVTIEGSEQVASGGDLTLTVKYQNNEKVVLGNVELTLQYPEGFTFRKATPAAINNANNTWDLGTIRSGGSGEIKITGQILGEIDSLKDFSAQLNYKPANFNAVFSQRGVYEVKIASSIIDLKVGGAKRAVADKEVTYTISYKNNSQEFLENVKIVLEDTNDFELKSSEPETGEEKNAWLIDRLESGIEGEIKLTGIFSGSPGDMRELKIKAGLVDTNNKFNIQVEKSILVLIVNPELTLELAVNGSTTDNTANFGETLSYLITYTNNSDLEIKDLEISAHLTGEVLDFESIDDDKRGKVAEQTITWNKEQIPGLAQLKPDDEGEIIFSIKVINGVTIDSEEDSNYSVVSKVTAKSAPLEELDGATLEADSNQITTKIKTQLNLVAEGRYYSEEFEQLGSGPLPPEVGKTTSYRIFWYLSNSTSEVSEIRVTTTIPDDIFWTGQHQSVTAGDLTFDPTTRKVSWEINKVPAGTGQLTPNLVATFEVSATPTKDQVGLFLVLTDKTVLVAKDEFTGANLTKTTEPITSDLKNDIRARDKGTVIDVQVTHKNTNANSNSNLNSNQNSNLNVNAD